MEILTVFLHCNSVLKSTCILLKYYSLYCVEQLIFTINSHFKPHLY